MSDSKKNLLEPNGTPMYDEEKSHTEPVATEISYADLRNEDLDDPGAILPQMHDPNAKGTVDAIPDMKVMTDNILELMDDLEKDEYKVLAERGLGSLLNKLYEKYDEEITNEKGHKVKNPKYIPYKLINILADPERTPEEKEGDIFNMLEMIERLRRIKEDGADMQEQFELYREGLKERHIYPKFKGGRAGFESAMNSQNDGESPMEPKKHHRRRTKKTFRKK